MKDNINRLLDAIEHPEQLSDEELDNLLDDSATRSLYHLLSKTADTFSEPKNPDIDAEWQKFVSSIQKPKSRPYRQGRSIFGRNVAATICIIASFAVVAATIGIKYTLDSPKEQVSDVKKVQSKSQSQLV